jgi:uncharacterized membrane protein (UPF0127 family)
VKNFLLLAVGLIFFGGCFYFFLQKPANVAPLGHKSTVTIGNTVINVDVSDTADEREQGLSGKTSLAHDTGMLFVFDTPGKYGFWMKDMNFPLDMVWISESGSVVSINSDVATSTYPSVYYPPTDIKYVLELPSHYTVEHGIDVGSNASLNL